METPPQPVPELNADHSYPPPIAPPLRLASPGDVTRTRRPFLLAVSYYGYPFPHSILPLTASSFRSYYLSGFLTLQTTLDRFMFNRALPGAPAGDQSEESSEEGFACVPPDVIGVPFPTAAYDQNLFYAAVGYLLGLAMTMVRTFFQGQKPKKGIPMQFEPFIGALHIA